MSRVSWAGRAPDDILALIFEHGAAGGWANAPLVVSHVCAKWRRASFVPRVWSHIHLTSKSLDPVAKTRLSLSRALQSPLYVTVNVRVLDPYILYAFDLVLEHATQWRTLTLNTRFVQQANDILSQCRHPFRYLHTLDITSFSIGVATEQGIDELTGFDDTFADAPSLSYVRVVSNRFPVSIPQTVVDLSIQLSDIASSRPSLSAALEMLGTLPTLRSLTLVIPSHFAQIVHDNEDPPDFNEVLQHIQTPVLRYLHLRSTEPPLNHPHEGTGDALLQFLKSSNLSLPLLEELRLHKTEVSNDALVSLHGPTGTCPRLKRLDLRWCEQLAG